MAGAPSLALMKAPCTVRAKHFKGRLATSGIVSTPVSEQEGGEPCPMGGASRELWGKFVEDVCE